MTCEQRYATVNSLRSIAQHTQTRSDARSVQHAAALVMHRSCPVTTAADEQLWDMAFGFAVAAAAAFAWLLLKCCLSPSTLALHPALLLPAAFKYHLPCVLGPGAGPQCPVHCAGLSGTAAGHAPPHAVLHSCRATASMWVCGCGKNGGSGRECGQRAGKLEPRKLQLPTLTWPATPLSVILCCCYSAADLAAVSPAAVLQPNSDTLLKNLGCCCSSCLFLSFLSVSATAAALTRLQQSQQA